MEIRKGIRRRAQVHRTLCAACGCCAKVCPLNAIEIFRGLYAQVTEKCVGCGKCVKECPASIITVREAEV